MAISAARRIRMARALELRAQGRSYRAIAAELGVSYKQIFEDVEQALADLPKGDTERARREMEERLDDLQNRLAKKLETLELAVTALDKDGEEVEFAGDIEKTTAAILRVEERRAKLLGLDAPVRAEVQHSNIQISVTNADDV